MVKIDRGKGYPKMLAKTSSEFKRRISGMTTKEAYEFYVKNKKREGFKYKTDETRRRFKKINYGRCSFCTKIISEFDDEMTVEHIKIKRDYPSKIFEWTNMLCACRTCNNKRGTRAFDSAKYLDPTKIEDIDKYFSYRLSGEIVPNDRLSDEEKGKAQYMIDMYKLNRRTLINERRKFMEDLMQDEAFYNLLKKKENENAHIIFLSLFTYYKKQRTASYNQIFGA